MTYPGMPPPVGPDAAGPPPAVCYRHPDRRAGVTCQRCGRPICPSCMVQASVGFHCVECVKANPAKSYRAADLVTKPVATFTLIGLNVALFLVTMGGTASRSLSGLSSTRLTDLLLLIGRPFVSDTGTYKGVAGGEWWRLITGGFLHAGLIHLGMNMFALYMIGRILEPALGRVRFVGLYTASLGAGALGVMVLSPGSATVGASGAIFGLMGVLVVLARSRGIDLWQSGIAQVIGLNLLITFGVAGISIGGHIGGLLGGLAVSYVMAQLERHKANVGQAVALCAGATVLFLALAVVFAGMWQRPLFG